MEHNRIDIKNIFGVTLIHNFMVRYEYYDIHDNKLKHYHVYFNDGDKAKRFYELYKNLN